MSYQGALYRRQDSLKGAWDEILEPPYLVHVTTKDIADSIRVTDADLIISDADEFPCQCRISILHIRMLQEGAVTIFPMRFYRRWPNCTLEGNPKLPQDRESCKKRSRYIADRGEETALKEEQGRKQERCGRNQLPGGTCILQQADRLGKLHGDSQGRKLNGSSVGASA